MLLTVLGYFAAGLARGVANSAFGRACRNFQELGVSPDQRRKARVKALNSEKPSGRAAKPLADEGVGRSLLRKGFGSQLSAPIEHPPVDDREAALSASTTTL